MACSSSSSMEGVKSSLSQRFPEENPFFNSVILENIFRQGTWTTEDLKTIRLVCKTWKEECLSLWRSTATLSLVQSRNSRNVRSGGSNGNSPPLGLNVTNFLEYIKDQNDPFCLARKPFSKYKLNGWRIDFKMRGITLRDTWATLGPLVRSLHLHQCVFHDPKVDLFKFLVYEASPNMTELKLTDNSNLTDIRYGFGPEHAIDATISNEKLTSFEFVGGRLPIPWTTPVGRQTDWEFLPTFPNLQNLRFGTAEKYSERGYNLISYWAQRQQLGHPEQIPYPLVTHLDLMHCNNLCEVPSLRLPLVSLSMSLEPGTLYFSCMGFCDILRRVTESLEVLKLLHPPFDDPRFTFVPEAARGRLAETSNFPIPQMTVLKELRLWGNVSKNLNFLRSMPNLEVLTIDMSCFEIPEMWYKLRNMVLERRKFRRPPNRLLSKCDLSPLVMERLTTFSVDCLFTCKNLRTLCQWMPHLKVFKTKLTNETFRTVCQEWPNLEELTVLFGSDVDDEGITGIATGGKRADPIVPLNAVNTIVNLKRLRRFSLQAYCDEGKLTDVAAHQGFLKLLALDTLHIAVSRIFSSEVELLLQDKIFQVRVIRYHEGSEKFECCRRGEFMNWMGGSSD